MKYTKCTSYTKDKICAATPCYLSRGSHGWDSTWWPATVPIISDDDACMIIVPPHFQTT